MKHCLSFIIVACCSWCGAAFSQNIFSENRSIQSIVLATGNMTVPIYVDANDYALVRKAASLLQQDIKTVIDVEPQLITSTNQLPKTIIIIGSLEQSGIIKELVANKKIDVSRIKNKWEAYQIQTVPHPRNGIENALVIVGSDRRGTAFGVFELSRQLGVSPWYWWADVPVKKKASLYIKKNLLITDAPEVKYRGIFINDEAPALSGWTREKFGGFNHLFYEKVFELMLRLKSNYLWPAMWGSAFYDDDSLNIKSAEEYGIVIGTSHHEPLMRAHDEWRRHGKGSWNYDSNTVNLTEFWRTGLQRASNEKIVSIGMRGDGDKPMTRETATALLERIVKDQRQIIEEVTGKPAEKTPQLWALYKEVQDYYDKGMRVPDDVTLLLCDDNWGNIRKLPRVNEKPRKGGYGIYYHFDYVGGPRNYKWVNTNPIPRVWEQMHLAWQYNVRDIWIVNVGDIKPMEFPISFFLDYAWNPNKIGPTDLQQYTNQWAADQFGQKNAAEIGDILSKYGKYNGRRKPELLDEKTYDVLHTNEAIVVTEDYKKLLERAEKINDALPTEYRDAFFQLVLHPVKACSNLYDLYTTVAKNKLAAAKKDPIANKLADVAMQLYINDSLITQEYHRLGNGKWNHMMSQAHIGYTYWQQPPHQKMPEVKYITGEQDIAILAKSKTDITNSSTTIPANAPLPAFYQLDGYVSIDASHFTRAVNSNGIRWQVLPDHGRTGSAITPFPVTALNQKPVGNAPHVEYDIYVSDTGAIKIHSYFSPTLNFHNDSPGLQFAISIDNEIPQIISLNKDDKNLQAWQSWVANNIIIKKTDHHFQKPGKHVIRFWMINPGVVLQKIVVDFGSVPQTYLGPGETVKVK